MADPWLEEVVVGWRRRWGGVEVESEVGWRRRWGRSMARGGGGGVVSWGLGWTQTTAHSREITDLLI